jgi:hypothetical protein
VVQESESIEKEASKFFVESQAFQTLKESVKKGIKYINLTGSAGTGKTTNAIILSKELKISQKASSLIQAEKIDLRESKDILFIDNIEKISKERLNKILNSNRIKQFVIISRNNLNLEKIKFETIKIPNLNLADIKNLIDKRLHNLDAKSSWIVYSSILKNREILENQTSPKSIIDFLNNTYKDINHQITNSNKESVSKDEKIKIPLSSVIGILISIILFLLTQKNSKLNTEDIIEQINSNQEQLLQLFELDNYEDDLDLCYLVSEDLNIRKYPRKSNSQIIKIANKNSTIKVIEKRDKWWYIESINIENNEIINGWVYSDYLLRIKQ